MALFWHITRSRSLDMRAGDTLSCDTTTGKLTLRQRGREIDLNSLCLDVAEGSGEMIARTHNPMTFLHMASILAATYGLAVSSVNYEGSVFTCQAYAP